MRRKSEYGTCHICGNTGPLTYEHIPPQAAFNKNKIFQTKGTELIHSNLLPWEFSGLKGKIYQGGVGEYTLCGKCNNNTGAWYANSFVDFVLKTSNQLKDTKLENAKFLNIKFDLIKPLNIIKQIIAMFFSVNNEKSAYVNKDLKEFILDKKRRGFDLKKHKFSLFILSGSMARQTGVSGVLNTITGRSRVFSEMSWPPFGYVWEFDPKETSEGCDISFFANEFGYDQNVSIPLKIPVMEINTYFPGDYRTRKEVLEQRINNKYNEMTQNIINNELKY